MIEQAVLLLLEAPELILGAAAVALLLAAEVGTGACQVAAAVQLQPAPGHAARLHQTHVLVSSLCRGRMFKGSVSRDGFGF